MHVTHLHQQDHTHAHRNDRTSGRLAGVHRSWRTPGATAALDQRQIRCASKRLVVSPAQPGGTRREVPGSDGWPGSERWRGQEHAAPRSASSYPLRSREELGGSFLGL